VEDQRTAPFDVVEASTADIHEAYAKDG